MPSTPGHRPQQTSTADEDSSAQRTIDDTGDTRLAGERAHLRRSAESLQPLRENVLQRSRRTHGRRPGQP